MENTEPKAIREGKTLLKVHLFIGDVPLSQRPLLSSWKERTQNISHGPESSLGG